MLARGTGGKIKSWKQLKYFAKKNDKKKEIFVGFSKRIFSYKL